MDEITTAVYKKAILLYEMYLEGNPVNVIDPDGRTPRKKEIRMRLVMLKEAVKE